MKIESQMANKIDWKTKIYTKNNIEEKHSIE